MSLQAGDKLGPYEILMPIGAGGMGEVYRARDTKLDRCVAIKVLPSAFAADPERMARLEREAKVLASLNHPNIAAIYGVEEHALVMELVEGESPKGPMPFEDAWKICSQIAEGLEYAHEKRVVHRDLKPANVKVTPEGRVKILDFGLAKVFTGETGTPPSPGVDSPTLTMGATQAGVILGTAAYMAPEQVRGKEVDRRADIWAFGVILYELLTGERLFKGADASETMARILTEDPGLERAPENAWRLLQSCLEKDSGKRLRAVGDAWRQLEQVPTRQRIARSRSRVGVGASIAAGMLFVALSILSFVHFREAPSVAYLMRFEIPLPEKAVFGGRMALSPDGRRLAFIDTGPEGGVWVRDLNSLEARHLPGTQNSFNAFWSPDSRFLAFGIGSQLKKADASGGPPQTLCESPTEVGSGTWNQEGVIVFGDANNGHLRRVSAVGGAPFDVTVVDASRGEIFHALPSFLPDGRHFVYFISSSSPEIAGIYIGSLDVKPERQSRARLLASQVGAVYAAGRLFFMRENTLMAQTFDAARLKLDGDPVPVVEQVGTFAAVGSFSVSASRVLAYRIGGSVTNRQLTWLDRQGRVLSTAGEPGPSTALSLSPDGARAAIVRTVSATTGDVWLQDFARGVSTRFTFDGKAVASFVSKGPVWSADGSRIVFRVSHGGSPGDLYEKASNGAGEEAPLFRSVEPKEPNDWSRDGRFLLYSAQNPKTGNDLMVLPLNGDHNPIPLVHTPFSEIHGSFSPDTRWFAYVSNESGRPEIYVEPFNPPGAGPPPAASKVQISRDGGTRPKWRADSKEIIFRAPDGSPTAVEVTTSPTLQPRIPRPLFALPANVGDWDVTSDGKRFLVAMPFRAQANTPITVVLNWDSELKK